MSPINEEYKQQIIKILNQYNTGLEEDIEPCAELIAEYMGEEVFQAICDARGD